MKICKNKYIFIFIYISVFSVNCFAGNATNSTQVLGQNPIPATQDVSTQKTENKQDPQALFEESLRRLMPLKPEQIRDYRAVSEKRERALSPTPPVLQSRTVRVSLQPGQKPPVVKTTANIATAIIFHDSTGEAWPVTSVTNGGPTYFQVLRPELPDANILNVIPQQDYGSATLVVTLAGQDVPLVIALEADSIKAPSRQADAMVLFQLAHHGPKAKIPIIKDIQETVTSDMLSILDSVPPTGAVRLRTEPQDENLEIWKIGSMHYLRTRHDLMWPAWTASVNGAGEVKCYELPQTPRLIVSRQGIVSTIKIREVGGDDNQK